MIGPGALLGPYRIEHLIGAGGMGQVFAAFDTRLHRRVAIKILPPDAASDPERKSRFLQEARAASALNHPSIVTLHDFASDGGVDYLVMEYVEGTSLERLIPPDGMPVADAIAYITQVASALAEAHAAGIVHRDIKPANIIVTGQAQAKVLDFGLAKLRKQYDSAETLTRDGVVMGTVAYMSPEQASGKPTDHRSDIFSLGVVLYELLTGRCPFTRKSGAESMNATINEPCSLAGLPPRLRDILDKCLDKNPRDRYQSAADLAVDLRRAERLPAVAAAASAPARRASWPFVLGSVALVVAFAVAAFFMRGAPERDLLAGARFTRVTDFPGDEEAAAISPDGKFVTFASDRDGPSDIWLTQIGTGQFQNITKGAYTPARGTNREADFNADGSEIWIKGPPPATNRMRITALFGASLRPFLGDQAATVTWSPDGARLAYYDATDGDPIFVADRNGENAKQIRKDPAGVHNHFPTWSPDGRWIYFVHGNVATVEFDLWRIAPDGSNAEQLTRLSRNIGFPTPLPDGRTVLFVGEDQDGAGPWLWSFDADKKVTRRIGSGLERYISIAATAGGRRLVASIANPVANLWTVPILDHPAAESDVRPYSMPSVRALSPRFGGGALFYLSSTGSGDGLWRYDQGKTTEIWNGTQGTLQQSAAISPDGREQAISVRRSGKRVLRVLSSDGSSIRDLSGVDVRGAASWSPDGKWLVSAGLDDKGQGVFKIPLDGTAPVRLASGGALNPVWSPRGDVIFYAGANSGGGTSLRAVTPDGITIDLPPIQLRTNGERTRFMPDGRGLVYTQGGLRTQDFWFLDVATLQTRPLTHLDNQAIMQGFDVSPDGTSIVFDRQRNNADVVLIDLAATK
jgi:Tol biopolymer transport system component